MGDSGRDAKFFQRGRAQELKAELNDDKKDKGWVKKKAALKKVIANATMGNDMSSLFPDMVACMNIQVLDIKKMVYLYLINYGRVRQDLIHTTIPGFLSDCNDRNPLIRALAIRTMSYIQVPVLISALIDPLRQSLKDADPYVRKTAAICVAKLYMYEKRMVDKHGFIGMLRDLLADSNPTVVANSVAALTEISERSDNIQLKLNLTVASKLVSALQECSEWGQVYILESLLFFVPSDFADAEILAERVAVRLSHSNSAVVLTAAKVILYLMNYISSSEFKEGLCKKLSPPLITLLSSGPEVQYVALRNILLIIQRRPIVLRNDVKVFFCKYNDPIYVKMAKLEIMYRLTTEKNVSQVLAELKEYASEVDVDFVRKAVRSIGRLAIKIEPAADRCINALVSLIQTKVNYVVQEAIVVIKDIFRKHPNRYESVIAILCENLDSLDQSEAKAAMIWIIGQYADRIENSDELLEDFLYSFLEEPVEVQLALLTATVKLFLKRPAAGGELVPKVLKWATEEVDNPDCRDRGFMYWRLLSTDPAAAREIVLADKPLISTETDRMDRVLLDQLLLHASTLSSIFHRQPQTFIRNAKARYIPDSPALDEGARRYASSHIYTRPTVKGPSVPRVMQPRSSSSAVRAAGASGAALAAANDAPPIGGAAHPSLSLLDTAASAGTGATAEGRAVHEQEDSVENSGVQGHSANVSHAEVDGPPSPAESGIGPVAWARHEPKSAYRRDSVESMGGKANGTDVTGAATGGSGEDPYAMLGDDFGGGGGYAADQPVPKLSALDELLM